MNIFLKSLVVVMVSWAVVEAVPAPDDGPPTTFDETDFWTDCVQDYDDPAGVCKQSGFSVTKKPDGSYTKAKQVNHLWTAGVNKCSDAPKRVRFFCSKDHSQAYWQGSAPACGSQESNERKCRENGFSTADFTSDFGNGHQCSWGGEKVLCVKE